MVLKLAYTDNSFRDLLSQELAKFDIELESYSELHFSEKKKAFKLKGGYGAKKSPFALLVDEKPIVAFYSEDNSCTVDNIIDNIKILYPCK